MLMAIIVSTNYCYNINDLIYWRKRCPTLVYRVFFNEHSKSHKHTDTPGTTTCSQCKYLLGIELVIPTWRCSQSLSCCTNVNDVSIIKTIVIRNLREFVEKHRSYSGVSSLLYLCFSFTFLDNLYPNSHIWKKYNKRNKGLHISKYLAANDLGNIPSFLPFSE